jgi:hypothetical protein
MSRLSPGSILAAKQHASLIMDQEGMRMPSGSETQGNLLFKLPFGIQSGNDRAALRRM